MTWQDATIPDDDEGRPMFRGALRLTNDKGEKLAGIVWFYDSGPFYASAMDVKQTNVTRRIGPCTTLEGAKQSCLDALEGRLDLSKRAGYQR